MKKIIFILGFLFFSFSLMASDRPNSLTFFGISSAHNNTKWATKAPGQNEFSPYENVSEFNARVNPSISFLRQVDNRLSMGFELSVFAGSGINNNDIVVDPNAGTAGLITTSRFKANYDSAIIMLLADYMFLRLDSFDFSLQVGAGLASHVLDLDYTIRKYNLNGTLVSSNSFKGDDVSSTYASKAGIIGSYNFTSFFGISLGGYYTYTGPAKFKLDNTKYRVKDSGITSVNLSFKWMF
ncbi:MAG: hypothetical protein FWE18_03385 [Alphaproteobacteria bacterium]|nr:hypothetical protein [Alphaproteobacteria bacterium]